MRRPKHKSVRRSSDEHVHDFIAHAPSDAFVRVAVSETVHSFPGISNMPAGTLVIDLERIEGPVVLRWEDANGIVQTITLTGKAGA